ncbi:hypothetical protein E2320_001584 [Naja naja]|nr:hypothetical protein E2320_001584 [Naja naja]
MLLGWSGIYSMFFQFINDDDDNEATIYITSKDNLIKGSTYGREEFICILSTDDDGTRTPCAQPINQDFSHQSEALLWMGQKHHSQQLTINILPSINYRSNKSISGSGSKM